MSGSDNPELLIGYLAFSDILHPAARNVLHQIRLVSNLMSDFSRVSGQFYKRSIPNWSLLARNQVHPVSGYPVRSYIRSFLHTEYVEFLPSKNQVIRLPWLWSPDIRLQNNRSPDIRLLNIGFPDIRLQTNRSPDIRLPDMRFPDIRLQNNRSPNIRLPNIGFPDIRLPH